MEEKKEKEQKAEKTEKKSVQGRVLEVVTNIYTDDAWEKKQADASYQFGPGDYRIRSNRIINVLEAKKSIKEFAWILHDKDRYSEKSKEVLAGRKKIGGQVPYHVHIVISGGSKALDVSYVAKWFGVPQNMVEVKRGRSAFIDAIRYLTHEDDRQQELGKHRYDDAEIHANFDVRKRIDDYMERIRAFGEDENRLYVSMRSAVYKDGMTLDALRRWADKDEHVREIYTQYTSVFKRLRGEYLSKQQPPEELLNIYVEGLGGYGKGALSMMLARYYWRILNPNRTDYEEVRDREMFFSVGDSRSGLQGYDGQQIVIWEDVRPGTLMSLFGGRGATFAALDPHPKDLDFNIKYATTKLLNKVNIMNSVIPFREFALQLTKPKDQVEMPEDYKQVTRRFCMWIVIREADYELMVNQGIYGLGTPRGFEDFKTVKRLDNNLIDLIKSANREAQNENMAAIVDVLPRAIATPVIDSERLIPREYQPVTAEQAINKWLDRHNAERLAPDMMKKFCAQVKGFLKEGMRIEEAIGVVDTQVKAHSYISMKVRECLQQKPLMECKAV